MRDKSRREREGKESVLAEMSNSRNDGSGKTKVKKKSGNNIKPDEHPMDRWSSEGGLNKQKIKDLL